MSKTLEHTQSKKPVFLEKTGFSQLYFLFAWLVPVALADWLINRTFSRAAIFMPKSPAMLQANELLGLLGQLAFTATGVATLAGVAWLALFAWRNKQLPLGVTLAALLAANLAFFFVQPAPEPMVAYHLIVLTTLGLLAWKAYRAHRSALVLLPALTLALGQLYQLNVALSNALHLSFAPQFSTRLFNLGELVLVLSPAVIWYVYARPRGAWHAWLLALPLPLAFAGLYLLNPSMLGVITIWSTGASLYLPMPLYAAALWFLAATVIALIPRGDNVAWALLLLLAGGYTPQLSSQVLLGVIALWLLAVPSDPSSPSVASPYDSHRLHSSAAHSLPIQ